MFAGLIAAVTGQGPHIQQLALQRLTVKVFAATAADAQRCACGGGGQNTVGERAGDGVHVLHAADGSGWPAAPA